MVASRRRCPHVQGWGAKAVERVREGFHTRVFVGQQIPHEGWFTWWPWVSGRVTTGRRVMNRGLALKLDLSALLIDGHFEMAQKCHAEKAHRHMSIGVDGDVDVACLGCPHAQ